MIGEELPLRGAGNQFDNEAGDSRFGQGFNNNEMYNQRFDNNNGFNNDGYDQEEFEFR